MGGCRQLRWLFPPPVDLVRENAGQFTPPLCLEGLDLGGFVTLQNPKIIAVETDGDPEFQEYIGITGGAWSKTKNSGLWPPFFLPETDRSQSLASFLFEL